jgi:hypothetical protein
MVHFEMLDMEAIFSQVESISNDQVCPSFVDAMDRIFFKLKDGLNTGTLLDGFTLLHWQPEEHSKNHHMRIRGNSRHMNWNWHVMDCNREMQNKICRETSFITTANAEATTSVPTSRTNRTIAPMQVLRESIQSPRTDTIAKKHRTERVQNPSCLLFL